CSADDYFTGVFPRILPMRESTAMDKTTTVRAQHKLGFLHHIRLLPLISSILGGIILLFALSAGLAGYFLLQADKDQQDVTAEIQVRTGLSNSSNHLRTA